MKKLRHILQPTGPLWLDIFFLMVPLLMLAPGFYSEFINPAPPERAYEGTFLVDGSLDKIGGVWGFLIQGAGTVFLIFFLGMPVIAAIRIFRSIKHKRTR